MIHTLQEVGRVLKLGMCISLACAPALHHSMRGTVRLHLPDGSAGSYGVSLGRP
jgi:hypothetical protein